MAAQVEVQTAEVGRTMAGGRHHLTPLTDSSNKSLTDIPSVNQPHRLASEPNKPVPSPKPRLTPKPFSVEKNPTIKPILAPKPQTKHRPESTRIVGYKPELPSNPKPQQPVASSKPRPVSTNPNRPASTSFNSSPKLNTGQTTKPVVQPFKPAPPLDTGEPSRPTPPVPAERQKPSSLAFSKSFKNLPAAEWSGTTKKEDEKGQNGQGKGVTSLTRAKSMGFLLQAGQEKEAKEKAQPETPVPLRPHPRTSRPRPVSAIFPGSPTKTEAPIPAPRWGGRRPLSADLTAKFESIGLSLHRKVPEANTKENTPEAKALPQRKEEKTLMSTTPESTDDVFNPIPSDQSNKDKEEMPVKEADEDKRGVSIKSRIILLLDSPSSPGVAAAGQGSDLRSPVQSTPEMEPAVGVKQLIKQLTEDTTPTQSPVLKPALKPRPLPLDLTKRFSAERSPDPVSLTEAVDRHDINKDPQKRAEESAITPGDQKTFLDLKGSQEQPKKVPTSEGPEAGQTFGTSSKESSAGSGVQMVRASLFDNVVERHSVLLMDEGSSFNTGKDLLSSPSPFKRAVTENDGTLVMATYSQPLSPSSPLPVLHSFDTVQAVEESRAVSESVPSAQWEDKAMTLRSRRSEGSRPIAEWTGAAEEQPPLAVMRETQPRYLRIGALQKWTIAGLDQDVDMEKGMLKESQREGKVALDKDRERQRMAEQEEVAAAPKRLKTLQAEEVGKPRATYFALTGQIQETVSLGGAGTNTGDMTVLFDDSFGRSVLGGPQGKSLPTGGSPSLDDPFGKTAPSQEQVEELMVRSHKPPSEIRSALDGRNKEEKKEAEKKREQRKEKERHNAKMKEVEREEQKQLEIEKQAHLEFARMKEREMQRDFERQRQKSFEKEKQEFEEKQDALDSQKQIELEKAQELEREKQRLEREKQRKLENEKRRELETQREIEREKMQERERQREKEQQKQKEEEQLLELQRQKQKEKEMQQLVELEKQRLKQKKEKEAEKLRQMALEQEMLRIKELEKEREREREMEKERRKEIEREKQRELEKRRQRDLEKERQRQQDIERREMENQRLRQQELEKERKRKEDLERLKELERLQLLEFEKQKQAEREREQIVELEKQRQLDIERQELENQRLRQQELEKERKRKEDIERLKELERLQLLEYEKQKQAERERQQMVELAKQRQLDTERQELENQRLRQQELEKERKRKEDVERLKELERLQLLEYERQKQAESERQIQELEKRRLREMMEREEAQKKEEADRIRVVAKQQEAERQRLKEKQRKEEQERLKLESSSPLWPRVLDLDSVLRNDPKSKSASQRSDAATRWKEPYKPAILDIDSFTPQAQPSPSKDLFPLSGIQGLNAEFGGKLQPTPENDVSWKMPPQTSLGFSNPVWTTPPQDPWELRSVEVSVDQPKTESRKHPSKHIPELLLPSQEERIPTQQRSWPAFLDQSLHLAPFPGTEVRSGNSPGGLPSSTSAEQIWLPRELQHQGVRGKAQSQRRSQGSQELNRLRSRSVSRRSAPADNAAEGSLSRMRSRSAHREQDRHSWVQQKQSVSGEEEGKDSPVHETDSQYGTWETGLRTDDSSLTPATPSSDSNLSPSPRKPTPAQTPGDHASPFESDTLDGLPPSSSPESQPLSFPDAPTTLLDTSMLRSRAQLGKKRAPRTRPTKVARQSAAQAEVEGGTTEDWLYRDSTEAKAESKDNDSDSEEQPKGADAAPAIASQPQRVALFPGMDPSALKLKKLKKRGDSDNQIDGPAPSPSQLSHSPKSPFLPMAARVLPPSGGKENGEEDSPQWLKELKSKKRLSQYENES